MNFSHARAIRVCKMSSFGRGRGSVTLQVAHAGQRVRSTYTYEDGAYWAWGNLAPTEVTSSGILLATNGMCREENSDKLTEPQGRDNILHPTPALQPSRCAWIGQHTETLHKHTFIHVVLYAKLRTCT